MNPRGISVFYGAVNEDIAIAEVRPPVGGKVVVGSFEVIRKLKVLDLRLLCKVYEDVSIFSPAYRRKEEHLAFLRQLTSEITKSVLPDDESLEYLHTQLISEFLADNSKFKLDGIIYPSIQFPGEKNVNVVLFHKSSRVLPLEHKRGFNIEVEDYDIFDGKYEQSYSVRAENVSDLADKIEGGSNIDAAFDDGAVIDPDPRVPALKIDLEDITVHDVRSVSFSTKQFVVSYDKMLIEKE